MSSDQVIDLGDEESVKEENEVENEPDAEDEDEEPFDESDTTPSSEQAADAQATAVAPAPGSSAPTSPSPIAQAKEPKAPGAVPASKEDPLDFDRSTITIVIKLHAQLGNPHPDGRRVSILVTNGSGHPVNQWYRARELSENSELDKLQSGIARTVHRFRSGELSNRKQKAWEQDQQRKAKGGARSFTPTTPPPPTTPSQPQLPPPSSNTGQASSVNDAAPASPPRPQSSQVPPVSPAPASRLAGKKKDDGLVQNPLF
jgi:hypothetical protein